MNTAATSWHLKIKRAKEHFAVLEAEIVAWLSTSPITMTKEKDVEGRRHALVAEIVHPPPLSRWSLISGDCVHNLRSALDSLLYGIAVHETGLNPPKDEARLQFPITSSSEKFNEDNNQKKIRSLSPAVQLEIESAQPYKTLHSELPPLLELLGFLDNFDKHRTLNVVAAVPHAASVYDMAHARDVTMTVSVYRTIISGKTEVVSFTIEPPNPSLDYKYNATITICVAHSPGPSKSPLSELLSVLTLITEEVERVVGKLEAIVGQMQNPVGQNPPQASHFRIDKDGTVKLATPTDQIGAPALAMPDEENEKKSITIGNVPGDINIGGDIIHGITQVVTLVASSGVAAGAYNLLKSWVDAKNGRKLRLKVGDVEVEATQMPEEDVVRLLMLLRQNADEKKLRDFLLEAPLAARISNLQQPSQKG